MPANACWERAFRTFSGLSAPTSESMTERPDVSLPSALFTVTTDLSIACIYVYVLSRSLFTIYRRYYLQRNRPLQFSDCAINSSVYISVWKCKLPFLLLAVFRVFAALVLESSSELVNAFVDFSQNTVVSETHARHRKKTSGVCDCMCKGEGMTNFFVSKKTTCTEEWLEWSKLFRFNSI